VDVFGVSDDDARSHEKFTEKYALNFQLLADTDHRMIESYGAWVEKRQYGRKFMGAKRVTYLIGADGSVEHVWLDVEPAAHVEEILSVLES
jgi:peroxiredoxin Q/BCP